MDACTARQFIKPNILTHVHINIYIRQCNAACAALSGEIHFILNKYNSINTCRI